MTSTAAPVFTRWLDDFLASYLQRRPVNATFIGMHAYDDRLPDLSESGMAATVGDADQLLRRLHSLPQEPLGSTEQLDRRLAEGFLLIQRWESSSRHFGWSNPCLFTGEAIFGLLSLLLRPFAPLEDRLRLAVARLQAVPEFLDSAARHVRAAPAAWIERARRECTGGQLLLNDDGLQTLWANVDIRNAQLSAASRDAAAAFAHFDRFLEHTLLPRATEDYACGGEAFDLVLRHGHFLETSAEDLERLALERMAQEDEALAESAPVAAAVAEMDGPYLTRFASLWRAAHELAEQHDLLSFPDWPVEYVEQPAWVRQAAPYLYFLPYRAPAPLDEPPVVEYFVPPGADESTIKLNHVVHHGSLGHHVQNWHAARAESRIARIAAVDCASRIAMLCGGTMAEGWACYATDLAEEAGFLTPSESYGQHQTRLRMAARTVVDIRLHHGQFSLAQSAAFYRERVGMTAAAARAEAVKNSLFPGTASMYLAGWEAIRRLRRELAARQPGALSLRDFHDRFLSFGSVPVSLVARAMLDQSPAIAHL